MHFDDCIAKLPGRHNDLENLLFEACVIVLYKKLHGIHIEIHECE